MRVFVLTLSLLLIACSAEPVLVPPSLPPQSSSQSSSMQSSISPWAVAAQMSGAWLPPVTRWQERATKKEFGTYITPETSPVQPERFTGYHSGLDLEVLDQEDGPDVTLTALCDGPVVLKQTVNGYGGVIMQKCLLANEPVTVLYGHVSLARSEVDLDQELKAGEIIGVLGDGFSAETDGERPHLHLSIHKGERLELRGYAASAAALDEWIDPVSVLE